MRNAYCVTLIALFSCDRTWFKKVNPIRFTFSKKNGAFSANVSASVSELGSPHVLECESFSI